jgi:hypothetical protein
VSRGDALSPSDCAVVHGAIGGWLKGTHASLIPNVKEHVPLVRPSPLDVFLRDDHPVE